MKQFPFVFEDIKRSKLYYLRFFIQAAAVALLVSYCFLFLFELTAFLSRFKIFEKLPEAYIVREVSLDHSLPERMDEPDFADRLFALTDYISAREDMLLCTKASDLLSLPIDKPQVVDATYGGFTVTCPEGFYPLFKINRGFMEVFELSVSEGRSLQASDFSAENGAPEHPPVLIGTGYTQYYKVGDIIDNNYGDTYEVVGILEDSAFYLWPGAGGGVHYLRDSIVAPMLEDNSEASIHTLCNTLCDSIVFSSNPSAVAEYAEKSSELRVINNMEIISFRDQLKSIILGYKQFIYTYGVIAALALIFCVSCSIASMLNYIDARKNEIFIHMLVGAKKRDVLVRLAAPPAAMLLTASLAALAVFRDLRVFALLLGFDCVLLLGMMLLPALKLKRQKLHELIKER